jgi:hypothetical protein
MLALKCSAHEDEECFEALGVRKVPVEYYRLNVTF